MANGFDLGSKLFFQGTAASSQYKDTSSLINNILPNVYIGAGIIIFFMIVLGGFTMIANATDTHKMEDGKKTITAALVGLLVIFASYWIIQIVQVVTGLKILNSGL